MFAPSSAHHIRRRCRRSACRLRSRQTIPGALAVLRRLITDPALNSIKVAVASSTTEPAWANRCLDVLMVDAAENSTVGALVDFRQICAILAHKSVPDGRAAA